MDKEEELQQKNLKQKHLSPLERVLETAEAIIRQGGVGETGNRTVRDIKNEIKA